MAWLPFAVALAGLAFVLGYAAANGVVAHDGERAPARVFQLLMLVQVTLVAAFAARWLPRSPRTATGILAAQLVATVMPLAALILLEFAA